MKLGAVVSASDLNPLYCNFIPVFIDTWKLLFPKIIVKVVLISDNLPEYLNKYKDNIVLFNIQNVSTVFQSQFIRLLYPALIENLNDDEGVIISDIDMIPMNRVYYETPIKDLNNDLFISYRNVLLHWKEIAMCYNIATPKVWKDIFNIHSLNDIEHKLITEYSSVNYDGKHGGKGWTTDQTRLFQIIIDWNSKTGRYKTLNDTITRYNRLDRSCFNQLSKSIISNIEKAVYTDYHMHRPFCKYESLINSIVSNIRMVKE